MKGIIGLLLLIASVSPSVVVAQGTDATTWLGLLENRTRTAYRYTHPPSPGGCGPVELPARAYLAPPGHFQPIGRTWQPGLNQSRWEPVRGPLGNDTLAVRVVDLWCGPTGRGVLVETNGYYLEVDANQIARVDVAGNLTPGILLGDGPDGQRIQLSIREVCIGTDCGYLIADAMAHAEDVRMALRAREEAERARLAQGQQRAETQATQRVQAGASVGAQMNAVLNRQLAETYQRLGATSEQANAIMQGRVLPGMTTAMVRAAIGEPREIRQEGSGSRSTTTWVYPNRQIVFAEGRVTEIR